MSNQNTTIFNTHIVHSRIVKICVGTKMQTMFLTLSLINDNIISNT